MATPLDAEPPFPFRNGVIYYVRRGDLIKIGTTMVGPSRWKIHDGTLVALEPGSYDTERRRHAAFAADRLGATEWFRVTERLLGFIRWLQLYAELVDGDDPKPTYPYDIRTWGVA